ncbi:MAG: DUF222 domain-containing protein, partial [Gordonia sp. (in: high G+C Gram-positive bacteria)]
MTEALLALPDGPSPWPELDARFVAGLTPAALAGAAVNDLLGGVFDISRGHSYLAWFQYRVIAELATQLVSTSAGHGSGVDGFADLAKRIARTQGVTQRQAERLVDEAGAVINDMPRTATTLRDGVITPEVMRILINRTALVHGRPSGPAVDADLADTLRRRTGVWSAKTARDLADRIVFRHDPDAVREQREKALAQRGMWTHYRGDGTGELGVIMAAENIVIAEKAIHALADTACAHDPRALRARRSDAMYA